MTPESGQKGLLGLPPELRDEIYSYIIIKPKNVITMLWNSSSDDEGSRSLEISAAQPALTRVSKQIRSETLPTFYNSNFFKSEMCSLEDLETARKWFDAVGETNVNHLRYLELSGGIRVKIGHGICLVTLSANFDLKDCTLVIEGNEIEIDGSQHVIRDLTFMKADLERMLTARKHLGFDIKNLNELVDHFFCGLHRESVEALHDFRNSQYLERL